MPLVPATPHLVQGVRFIFGWSNIARNVADLEVHPARDDEGEPLNPYAPPRTAPEADSQALEVSAVPADRATRLAATFADRLGAYVFGSSGAAAVAATLFPIDDHPAGLLERLGTHPMEGASLVAWIAFLAAQTYLLATTGQSMAKRAFRIRIVRTSDRPAGLVRAVLLRSWLFVVPIPAAMLLGPNLHGAWLDAILWIWLAEPLLIFRADRRCLHDLVAGTKVVRA
jgi:uncharacterized RDD family membrane protein YckC